MRTKTRRGITKSRYPARSSPACAPKQGSRDFATITIKYVPDKLCVELKSLKLYMFSYRNTGEFHEHVTNRILNDFVYVCDPRSVEVTGDFNVRGGIKTVVRAAHRKDA